ncbi:COG0863 DNA modification methylase [uncultured Caudovirales phage]|uniref:COG0863 DNA modification methylase n=1 Tax=uncultured Caudovirales phage TaxID=2100421 RepID=A0A6J5NN44_9CAUD|nr:COG0863 DNA modification methylase [uncultured Caudovirales phage]
MNIAKDLQSLAVPVENLTALDKNARRGDVDAVAKSYQQFGQRKPIVAKRNKAVKGGKPTGMVIAGNHQLLAAKQLGWTEIAVVFTDDDDKTARAFALADNRTHDLGDYDNVLLAELLEELKIDDDLFGASGYTPKDLKNLLSDNAKKDKYDGKTDPDDIPETPTKPKSKAGDIYKLGNHRLFVGDSCDPASYEKLLEGGKAQMCFTDPPYNVNYKSANDNVTKKQIMNDNLGDDFYAFLHDACQNIVNYTDGGCYLAMSSSELHTLQRAWLAVGGHWSTFIIWAKNTFTLGRSDYHRQYEPILYGWNKKTGHKWHGDRSQGDVWFVDKPRKSDLHPTMKPVELVEKAIHNSSQIGEQVLDPFGGSGTTLIACERTGRHARMIELDPRFADVIIKRWEDHTGLTAEKVS